MNLIYVKIDDGITGLLVILAELINGTFEVCVTVVTGCEDVVSGDVTSGGDTCIVTTGVTTDTVCIPDITTNVFVCPSDVTVTSTEVTNAIPQGTPRPLAPQPPSHRKVPVWQTDLGTKCWGNVSLP
ncbi:12841_t:CDS:2 [Ambispora leptoticha]|uniref:12841_t:CDS:1 n=1 Tax=Ambispora leptoticha TaxID=144679 RepID=A0A9N8ZDP0_9GLOM|nr:12841_t:CDS:2 [Ambispora leptoticha]